MGQLTTVVGVGVQYGPTVRLCRPFRWLERGAIVTRQLTPDDITSSHQAVAHGCRHCRICAPSSSSAACAWRRQTRAARRARRLAGGRGAPRRRAAAAAAVAVLPAAAMAAAARRWRRYCRRAARAAAAELAAARLSPPPTLVSDAHVSSPHADGDGGCTVRIRERLSSGPRSAFGSCAISDVGVVGPPPRRRRRPCRRRTRPRCRSLYETRADAAPHVRHRLVVQPRRSSSRRRWPPSPRPPRRGRRGWRVGGPRHERSTL